MSFETVSKLPQVLSKLKNSNWLMAPLKIVHCYRRTNMYYNCTQ